MKYNSIREYFYSLSNRCLLILAIPILIMSSAFLSNIYLFSGFPLIEIPSDFHWEKFVAGECLILLVMLTVVIIFSRNAIKGIVGEPSLAAKMERYVNVVVTRYIILMWMIFFSGSILFLSTEVIFLIPLPLVLIPIIWYWPTVSRMSKDLKLKADETKVLRNKKI